ncbi:hypothetical protein [Paraburkholderia tagetis]|uniref:Uncharacterized protein n=1 Tax=Paraburkholderia tagetis TaxID=2913261 RepID=A0A9X1UK81_9BURK|nr:hypothetical protein [Paraburkholderia tagetis]MCG5072746.1 hypothetical protein [Paraburkholderia tagetis]
MVVQRLSIQAAKGKLQVIPVWQCLARNGAKVRRWNVSVDCKTGVESMTIDIAVGGPQCTANIIATLGTAPLDMTVTPLPLAWARNTERGEGDPCAAANPRPNPRLEPKLTVVERITDRIATPMQD